MGRYFQYIKYFGLKPEGKRKIDMNSLLDILNFIKSYEDCYFRFEFKKSEVKVTAIRRKDKYKNV